MAQTVKTVSTIDLTFSDRAGNQFTWKLNNPKSNLTWSSVDGFFTNRIKPYITYFQSKYNSQIVSLDSAATVETVTTKTTLE